MAGPEPWIEGTEQGDTVPSGKSMREALERRKESLSEGKET
jgi:hypothetical protein